MPDESLPKSANLDTVGARIAAARERLGISKLDLAEKIGRPGKSGWRSIHKWEYEGQIPDIANLLLLADALQVSADELMGKEPPEPLFEGWRTFLKEVENEQETLTPEERRGLCSIYWGKDREPTARGYWSALTTLRTGAKRR